MTYLNRLITLRSFLFYYLNLKHDELVFPQIILFSLLDKKVLKLYLLTFVDYRPLFTKI